MSRGFDESPEAAKARRQRGLAIALALAAFVALLFVVTIVRIGGRHAAAPGL